MSEAALRELAAKAGIAVEWEDFTGRHRTVQPDVIHALLDALGLPSRSEGDIAESLRRLAESSQGAVPPLMTTEVGRPTPLPAVHVDASYHIALEDGGVVEGRLEQASDGAALLPAMERPGYHRLSLGEREITLATAPGRCFTVADAVGSAEPRLWGLSVQLYGLRREQDLGVGDFSALAGFAQGAGRRDASAIVISPVHALFAADPDRFSPYAPSSRVAFNVLYADAAGVAGADSLKNVIGELGLEDEVRRLEGLDLIDWRAVSQVKLAVLRRLFEANRSAIAADVEYRAFKEASPAFVNHARFEALHAHFFRSEESRWHWRDWPQAYRDPNSAEVSAFAREHAEEVEFALYLQWLVETGMKNAQAAARAAGMPIGLIADLAIGIDSGGSQAWSRQDDMLIGPTVGAPPDLINAQGQGWGLAAFSPTALRQNGFGAFLEMLRTALAHAGGIRIDHAMGLMRLWLIPEGAAPNEGAYLSYPWEDLLRLIALESWRHRAIVIGEDLGTVPEGFGEMLAERGVLGTRVMWFERWPDCFKASWDWSRRASATSSTHDLATVAGWWAGRDIEWRTRLELLGEEETEAGLRQNRGDQREQLWNAFRFEGIADGPVPVEGAGEAVVDAAVEFLARTPSPLAVLPLEDALGLVEQPNLPGTVEEHPNWQRRYPGPARELADHPAAAKRLDRLNALRGPR